VDARAEAEAARSVEAAPVAGGRLRRYASRAAEPLARAQRTFNDAILRVTDALSERIDDAAARADRAERRVRELEDRLLRLERGGRTGPAAATVASQPRQSAFPDYFAYEARMRAPVEEVRQRQRPYVELLRPHAPVLDVGCGRGELLQLLAEAGIESRGVDADADMVAFARGAGLRVEQADLLDALAGASELGAITALQVVEHLPPPALLRLLELAARKLRPGGLLVAETINPLSPLALRNYFADLTHAQPLVPATLELLVREAGFSEVEVRYVNEPGARLADVELPEGEQFDAPRAALAANTRLLNETLFPPLDYAVVARRA
jgi:O-antigen chain-terminating methyltransferase